MLLPEYIQKGFEIINSIEFMLADRNNIGIALVYDDSDTEKVEEMIKCYDDLVNSYPSGTLFIELNPFKDIPNMYVNINGSILKLPYRDEHFQIFRTVLQQKSIPLFISRRNGAWLANKYEYEDKRTLWVNVR